MDIPNTSQASSSDSNNLKKKQDLTKSEKLKSIVEKFKDQHKRITDLIEKQHAKINQSTVTNNLS
jgi:hypothetical protein